MRLHLPIALTLWGAACQRHTVRSTPKGLYPVTTTSEGVDRTEYLLVADATFGTDMLGGRAAPEAGCPKLGSTPVEDPDVCIFSLGAGMTLTLYTINRTDLHFSVHRPDPVEIRPPGPAPMPATAPPSTAELKYFDPGQPDKYARYVLLSGPELGEVLLGPERMGRCTGEPGAPPEQAACAYALDPCTSVWVGVGKQVQVQFLPGTDCPKPFRLL